MNQLKERVWKVETPRQDCEKPPRCKHPPTHRGRQAGCAVWRVGMFSVRTLLLTQLLRSLLQHQFPLYWILHQHTTIPFFLPPLQNISLTMLPLPATMDNNTYSRVVCTPIPFLLILLTHSSQAFPSRYSTEIYSSESTMASMLPNTVSTWRYVFFCYLQPLT